MRSTTARHAAARSGWSRRIGLVTAVTTVAATMAVAGPLLSAGASHGDFEETVGVYRIPYADGTDVTVTGDHHNHGGANGNRNRFDMSAGVGADIVAAASGWIRAIVDHNGNSPGAGDGVDTSGNLQDDSLEHSCGNNDPGNTVTGDCADYNNYVWIEHPNGEWSKYSHFGTGTVSAQWDEGDWVNAGQILGDESDIGFASSSDGVSPAYHLHHEIAVPNDPDTDLTWSVLGGFFDNGRNVVPIICDIGDPPYYADGATYTAAPCNHAAPTADAGGPYSVDEGSSVQLDGTGSDDPEGAPLTYRWLSDAMLDGADTAQPTYAGVDDGVTAVGLDVYDQVEALRSSALTSVKVDNVPPAVTAVGDAIDEAGVATVSATFTDPGTLDTHTATVDWGDGTAPQGVDLIALAAGLEHVYGDDGNYAITVTVTDDDGGVGSDTVAVVVGNLAPVLALDTGDVVAFPGGDYAVVEAGDELTWSASGEDAGSDDLTFTWGNGDQSTSYNGIGPDPDLSPYGTFPFHATDDTDAGYAAPGVDSVSLILSDDDGGSDSADAGVVVTGVADATQGTGWWKHEYGRNGAVKIDAATLSGYLEVINAVSSVFSESVSATTFAEAHKVLSPTGGDRRARTVAELFVAWNQFASGAVAHDAAVMLHDGTTIGFLELVTAAEAAILDPTSTDAELHSLERSLSRVRHAI